MFNKINKEYLKTNYQTIFLSKIFTPENNVINNNDNITIIKIINENTLEE